jgi:hypothetical protein
MYQDESLLAPHPTKSALLYNLHLRSGRANQSCVSPVEAEARMLWEIMRHPFDWRHPRGDYEPRVSRDHA